MFSSKNRLLLKNQGLYYPVSGQIPGEGSHHNISFEFGKFLRQCHPEYGTLADLTDELKREKPDTILLSSELLSSLLEHKECLLVLQNAMEDLGYLVSYVVYLRNQESVISSIYSETIKHGSKEGFSCFLNKIVSDGKWKFPFGALYYFDYASYVSEFASSTGRNVIVRNYHTASDAGGILKDLLSVISPDIEMLYDNVEWTNHKYGPHVLQALRLINDLGDWPRLPGAGKHFVERLMECATRMDGPQGFDGLSPADVNEIRSRFLESNTILKNRWGIDFISGPATIPKGLAWRPIVQGHLENETALLKLMREAVLIASSISSEDIKPS
jgi:hypothetical protein